jgi:hypothetical protein
MPNKLPFKLIRLDTKWSRSYNVVHYVQIFLLVNYMIEVMKTRIQIESSNYLIKQIISFKKAPLELLRHGQRLLMNEQLHHFVES